MHSSKDFLIVDAYNSLQQVEIRLDKGVFPDDLEIAFNRSMPAYNANPEVKKLSEDQCHLALDRSMTLLRIDTTQGKTLATIAGTLAGCKAGEVLGEKIEQNDQ